LRLALAKLLSPGALLRGLAFRVDDQITDTKGPVNLKCKVLATTYNTIT
jgi:hypothetical protein